MINQDIIRSTKEGKLYITNFDFFNDEKIKQTIIKLLDSDIIKNIERREYDKKMGRNNTNNF